MPSLPIGQDHDARPSLADYGRDFQTVLPGVFHAAVGNVEGSPPTYTQDSGRIAGFAGAVVGRAARTHLALGQVKDAGAVSELGHLEQRAAAGLLYIVAVSGDGQDIERLRRSKGSHVSRGCPAR